MKRISILLIFFSILLLYSCGSNENKKDVPYDLSYELHPSDNYDDEHNIDELRKLIKKGIINFETSDVFETKSSISNSVNELGGYISNENIFEYKDRLTQQLTIRIPANKFDILLDKISSNALKIDSKNIEVLDVTEEYIDIEARLKTKKELENRYIELLAQAKKVDEILNIEREIGILRSEIESNEGRLNYLKDRIAFSTLNVEYYQKISAKFGFWSKFVQALVKGWDVFLLFIIGLTHIWIFILLTIILIIIIRIYLRKKKRNNF